MKQYLVDLVNQAIKKLQQIGELPAELEPQIQIDPTRDKQFGDYATNIALSLAKSAKQKPRELASKIVAQLPKSDKILKIDIAGPGFINFYLSANAFYSVIPDILTAGKDYGHSQIGNGKRIHMEYVSSNPTGPLHVGHGRGAAYGATVADLLEAIGYQVHREYYVNDAGRQMDIVTVSIWLRYLEKFGEKFPFPAAGYKGDYIINIAKELKIKYRNKFSKPIKEIFADLPKDSEVEGSKEKEIYIDALIQRAKQLLGKDFNIISELGLKNILEDMHDDLAEFGVTFQNWFHESSLIKDGALQRTLDKLKQTKHLYEKDGALWFRATDFGDEKDRVVIRENGQPTYFATDMAYHFNKFERNFDQLVDIFGSDHHGYAPRVKAFLQAVNFPVNKLIILLVQFAILYRGKEKISMSTRAGTFVTLRELRNEVGNDAARFFYVMRKPDQHLDFDLELAKSQSSDNPVYYIQYAHARICSVFRQMEVKNFRWDKALGLQNLASLTESHEKDLLRCLAQYQDVVITAATQYEPHILAHYLQELANYFHAYYNSQQFLVEDEKLRNARLALIMATKQVLANGLNLLGVSAPKVM